MRTSLFIAIILLSGCSAGVIHGLVNLALVEPYLDRAIGIENQHMFTSGEAKDTPQFWAEYYSYRAWQKGGQLLAGAMLGTAIGALFGIVFGYARNILPGNSFAKKALVLAAIMWITLYLIPFAKYPANPPTVGDPETILLRQMLYVSFIAISGFGALGFYLIFRRLRSKRFVAVLGYAGFIGMVFALMPQNPDAVTAPTDLVNGFRAMSLVGVTAFWLSVGLILGALWQKLQPDRVKQTKFQ
ncbi:CbtA family protein [Candidatus Nitrosotenuis chungbukensis]|uniref:CbtA family protein n=1 Tax=Candidatus Nitrosotenuis chungbukensis TaxID=1353246 RepID=UPI0005B2C841|nr:CbtA family protein [Candidatus Nitrosotenuis chungbukensis]WKT57560.1 CbtA family protein [Candidatus Nitrosotenuis chungbukensis]